MTTFRYSSTTLETIRFGIEPTAHERVNLLASGWERHPFERRLYLLKRGLKAMRLSQLDSFVLPQEADWFDPDVRAALR